MYKMYICSMKTMSVASSQFRQSQSQILEEAQHTPVAITSRGSRIRAFVVSPSFFARAVEALEDREDVQAAEIAREESVEISHEDLKKELGLT
ncbi:prevent-host-death family protein [Corynebacterium sp. HMSC056F09]|nr:prevent-host-death family protein [Corynebacterium sp. HMSC056F09]OFO94428.1 prevent-host-death family protein [Corynebacterium sp. HMSC034H07]